MRGRKDLGDYQPSLTTKGGYEYMGEYYIPIMHGKQLLRHKLLLCALSLLQALCVYAMGSANSPGFRQIYVIVPFLVLVFFTGRSVIGAFSFFTWRDAMTKRQYQASEMPFEQSQRILPLLSVGLFLTELVFLFLGGVLHREWFVLLMAFLLTGFSLLAKHVLAHGASVNQAQGKALDIEARLQKPAKFDIDQSQD